MMRPPIDDTTILITGASSGIGRAMAIRLAPRARTLVVVARRAERLDALRSEILAVDPTTDVHPIPCDLADPESRRALLERLEREVEPVDVLVNCAGFGDQSAFSETGMPEISAMIALNCEALTHLCRALIPTMVERGHGGVLNVGSQLGLVVQPAMAVYSATKHYVDALSESLRVTLAGSGVCVTQLCPGPVRTEFADVAGYEYTKGSARDRLAITADECARIGLEGFEAGKALVIPQRSVGLIVAVMERLPRPARRRFAARMARAVAADRG